MGHPGLIRLPATRIGRRVHRLTKQRPVNTVIPPVATCQIRSEVPPLNFETFMWVMILRKEKCPTRFDLSEAISRLTQKLIRVLCRSKFACGSKDDERKEKPSAQLSVIHHHSPARLFSASLTVACCLIEDKTNAANTTTETTTNKKTIGSAATIKGIVHPKEITLIL